MEETRIDDAIEEQRFQQRVRDLVTDQTKWAEVVERRAAEQLRKRRFDAHAREVDTLRVLDEREQLLKRLLATTVQTERVVTIDDDWHELRPKQYTFGKVTESVETWKEMYERVARLLYGSSEERFVQVAASNAAYATERPDARGVMEVGPYYVKTYNSTRKIRRLLAELFRAFGYPTDALRVTVHPVKG